MKRLVPTFALGFLAAILSPAFADDATPSPADDLKAMQGNWKVTSSIGGASSLFGETPKIIKTLGDERLALEIKGNQFSFSCIRSIPGETLSLANDLPLPQQAEQLKNSVSGDRLLMLTQSSGKGLLASYNVTGDRLTIRYPAGCCSRSGNVISFERVR